MNRHYDKAIITINGAEFAVNNLEIAIGNAITKINRFGEITGKIFPTDKYTSCLLLGYQNFRDIK